MRRLIVMGMFLAALLSGCGFQLRGTATPLPERFAKTYFIDSSPLDDNLALKIKNLIVLNGGELVSREMATVAVKVGDVKVYSRQIAESSNGSVKEYESRYSTTVTVTDLKTNAQLGSREISVIRNIQLSSSKVLAGEEQSKVTKDNAESSLAQAAMLYFKTF